MTNCDDIDDMDEGDCVYPMTTAAEDIQYIETTNEWSQCMATSSCTPKHVWTKKEEGIMSMGGWKSENVAFCNEGLLNKPFSYYDELVYVFGRDRAMGRFTETFADVESNEPDEYEGFDMSDGKDEFLSVTIVEWLARALANDNHVRQEFFRIVREMSKLTSLDRALLQRHLLSRMDDMWDLVQMPDDERESFCRVLLRDISR
ncbi:retrotransposon protein [Cucumis melo var. makuwa]|uniref:Retrotransposon protein n=1 Tax=Cucumis melo var. makuwa TaxID=1194695 RepID=A0A5A7UEC7_CUCMM|nr:retrotransposon protein [Cucumis melo var. makuwa]TYK00680.1 retrotransposon protein [Cucumis melo var. makuwa]